MLLSVKNALPNKCDIIFQLYMTMKKMLMALLQEIDIYVLAEKQSVLYALKSLVVC